MKHGVKVFKWPISIRQASMLLMQQKVCIVGAIKIQVWLDENNVHMKFMTGVRCSGSLNTFKAMGAIMCCLGKLSTVGNQPPALNARTWCCRQYKLAVEECRSDCVAHLL